MLKSLDLFTGIGGITHALRGLATPVMYCEKDPDCIRVLQNLMAKGKIPKAPVSSDVQKLTRVTVPGGKVDLIVAGFPCFVAGTLVTTYDGYKPIEQVTTDDLLLTHTGAWGRIENTQTSELPIGSELFSIRIKGSHTSVQATGEHPFYARLNGGPARFVCAKDLTRDHMLGMPIDQRAIVPEFRVPMGTAPDKTICLNDPDHWWMLGYFLGDGWTQDSEKENGRLQYRTCFAVSHSQEASIVPQLEKVLHLTLADKQQGCNKYVACNKAWWTILQDFGRCSHGKGIPDWVHAAPTHLLAHFVEGYRAADGCIKHSPGGQEIWKFATVSIDIALGLQRLLAKLKLLFGISFLRRPPTTVIAGRTVNQRDCYEVSGRPNRIRERCGSFIEGGYVWHAVSSVSRETTSDPQTVYNFQVEHDNSYCVLNTAVHNCQGFSTAGDREGLAHAGSSLFSQVVRLAKTLRPPLMFLENVAAILGSSDIGHIVKSLTGAGYDLYWVVMPAFTVGAPQGRARWFCLCIRRGVTGMRIRPSEPFTRHDWSKEPVDRMVPRSTAAATTDRRRRLRHLGNSVVPDCVRGAFMSLFTGCVVPVPQLMRTRDELVLSPPKHLRATRKPGPFCSVTGAAATQWWVIPKPPGLKPKPKMDMVLDPRAYFPPKGTKVHEATSGVIQKPMRLFIWATPRHGNGSVSGHTLSVRGCNDLGTQLRFERSTPKAHRYGVPNSDWVEWLMGFPRGWTTLPKA